MAKGDDANTLTLNSILSQHQTFLNIEEALSIEKSQKDVVDTITIKYEILSKNFAINEAIQKLVFTEGEKVKRAFNHAAYCYLQASRKKQYFSEKNIEGTRELKEVLLTNAGNFSETWQEKNEAMISQILKRAQEDNSQKDQDKDQSITNKRQKLKTEAEKNPSIQLSSTSTKASSSIVDSRATVARAILCATASVAFSKLTPDEDIICIDPSSLDVLKKSVQSIDVLDIPQNSHFHQSKNPSEFTSIESTVEETNEKNCIELSQPVVNMGAVMMQAKTLGNRAISYGMAASRRARERHKFALELASQHQHNNNNVSLGDDDKIPPMVNVLPLCIPNPFGLGNMSNSPNCLENVYQNLFDNEDDPPYPLFNDEIVIASKLQRDRNRSLDASELTPYWRKVCLTRMKKIISTGLGNMVYYDKEWNGRAARVADFLRHLVFWGEPTRTIVDGDLDQHHDSTSCDDNSSYKLKANYGPHLIVCTETDLELWIDSFARLGFFDYDVNTNDEDDGNTNENEASDIVLRALLYSGSSRCRRRVRRHLRTLLPIVNGYVPSHCSGGSPSSLYTKNSPFHVVITSYQIFIKDYAHLTGIPWQVVSLDDGMGLVGAAHHDPNGKLGRAFDGLFSKADGGIGTAGAFTVNPKKCEKGERDYDEIFEFYDDDESSVESWESSSSSSASTTSSYSSYTAEIKKEKKKALREPKRQNSGPSTISTYIGLTCRHRLLIASSMTSSYRGTIYKTPVPALLSFLIPPFSEVTREEWDRSRVHNCSASMDHYRSLLARSVVTYFSIDDDRDVWEIDGCDGFLTKAATKSQIQLGRESMIGAGLFAPNNVQDGVSSQTVSVDQLVVNGKFMQSRRFAAAWLTNNLRRELVSCSLDPILDAIQSAGRGGHVCEEVVAAPVTTSSLQSGNNQVGHLYGSGVFGGGGGGGFSCAIRCGRVFTSEQGLRQHMAALHAPPGTWLCRSCGGDCGTSQARTHHERYCATGSPAGGPNGGAISTVGQHTAKQHGPGVGKTSGSKSNNSKLSSAYVNQEKVDKDGSFRVPGFRGVWVNPAGKNFVKYENEPYLEGDKLKFFDTAEEAAMYYDEVVKEKRLVNAEKNYREDGKTRIVYEDKSAVASGRGLEMLGGGASSVVPALSVINIKDLPKHVKPLLRDPKQTSRTGGNSKRYVYAYRGVCRQARKGHDRWQSQISFGGTNHYLGTFDSEWDAAAIYAWAHLILYGEEATKRAQREGEEAAAAWEQEKKDIAEGKIVPQAKPVKKKTNVIKIARTGSSIKGSGKKNASAGSGDGRNPTPSFEGTNDNKSTEDSVISGAPVNKKRKDKKPGTSVEEKKIDKMILSSQEIAGASDRALLHAASKRLRALRVNRKQTNPIVLKKTAICVGIPDQPQGQAQSILDGQDSCGDSTFCRWAWAMLVGLSAQTFEWTTSHFISEFPEFVDEVNLESLQDYFFDAPDSNTRFRCFLQGTCFSLGRHDSVKLVDSASASLGLPGVVEGGPAGSVDCHVGGPSGSCSDMAAKIMLLENGKGTGSVYFYACNNHDVVSLNGERIEGGGGPYILQNMDVCSVGSRVFMFLLPSI